MNPQVARWLIYVGVVLGAVAGIRIFLTPIRFIFKLILNTILGFLLLIVFNFFGKYIGVTLGCNVFNAGAIGIFGPIGLILLLLLRWLTII